MVLFYAEALHQALTNFHFLETLHLGRSSPPICRDAKSSAAGIVVADNQGQRLKELKLEDVSCDTLDLRYATRLTYLNLSQGQDMYWLPHPEFVMHLPTSLVVCTLVGVVVSLPATRLMFDPCKELTKLCLGINHPPDAKLLCSVPLPDLPSSLRHLAVQARLTYLAGQYRRGVLECEWHCLHLCQLAAVVLAITRMLVWLFGDLHILDFANDNKDLIDF